MNFEVNREDYRETRVVDGDEVALEDGQIRLRVERFAFTANNISYAVSGDMLGYWDFFPAEAPWGRLPTMGLGSVVESAHPEIELGGRYFGFYPMADDLVIAARPNATGFVDAGPHRSAHAATYVTFTDTTTDPGFTPERADEYLLLRGLFMTSYLAEDFLAAAEFYGADQTIVTSASSKTSIALAACLSVRGRRSVGLTSAGNRDFVEGLGLYTTVTTYEEIEELDPMVASVVVDMAGSANVRERIHGHFADSLRYSMQVGATHWEELSGDGADLAGPTPEFFFAPGQIAKRSADWGAAELMARIGAAFSGFVDDSARWLTVERSAGPDAVAEVYADMLEGRAAASVGHILSMTPAAFTD